MAQKISLIITTIFTEILETNTKTFYREMQLNLYVNGGNSSDENPAFFTHLIGI